MDLFITLARFQTTKKPGMDNIKQLLVYGMLVEQISLVAVNKKSRHLGGTHYLFLILL
jgi:hypothetical protein